MKPFSLISLQIKTPAQVKLYISIVCFTIVLGLVLFVFNKRFRSSVIDYVNNHVFFVSIFSAFYLTYLVTRIFFVNTVFKSLFQEDGFFEYLTTLFFLMASLFFLLAFIKSKGNANSYTRIFIFGLLLFCFIIGMEEISWGQRILGIETPESFMELNYQEETTVHNLISPTYHPLLYFTFSLLCLVFFAFTNSKYDSLIWINQRYLPSKKFLVIALLLPLIAIYNMEHFEVILSFMFCIYGYQLWKKFNSGILAKKSEKKMTYFCYFLYEE